QYRLIPERATGFEPATSSLGKGLQSQPRSTETLSVVVSYALRPRFASTCECNCPLAKNRGDSAASASTTADARKLRGRTAEEEGSRFACRASSRRRDFRRRVRHAYGVRRAFGNGVRRPRGAPRLNRA